MTNEQRIISTSINTVVYDELIGEVITNIEIDKIDNSITFTFQDGKIWKMLHEQDCCESVCIESIVGDIADLLNTPLLKCEEVSNQNQIYMYGSETYTFYKFATIKGYIDIRWIGYSNGYYSEEVSFYCINKN